MSPIVLSRPEVVSPTILPFFIFKSENKAGKVCIEKVELYNGATGMYAYLIDPFLKGDFNGNGRVDIGDAAKIAYYLVGKISEL